MGIAFFLFHSMMMITAACEMNDKSYFFVFQRLQRTCLGTNMREILVTNLHNVVTCFGFCEKIPYYE